MKNLFLPVILLVCSSAMAHAQMVMSADSLIEAEQQHSSSGTSIEPASTPVPMLMTERHGWQLMLHGNGFAADIQQQAAAYAGQAERGRDAFFSTNWLMPMAQHPLGPGQLTLRAMLSLEPATVGARAYPELFQQGETAFNHPIVDGQHPHGFFMELGALYDLPIAHYFLLSLYAAPVGDPALGPTAYPHRLSASEDPIAALGHHQQDSTHIAFNVLTGGITWRWLRAELSGFHGGEPDEHRWALQPSPDGHAIDSASGRLTVSPTADITAQYSAAHIHAPEALYPSEDQQRQTASIMVHHAFKAKAKPMSSGQEMPPDASMKTDASMASMPGMDMASSSSAPMQSMPGMAMGDTPHMDLAITAIWGRTKSLADASKENSYLAEALLRFGKNYAWTRLEDAGRSNELELTPGSPLPTGFTESPAGHVAAYTLGYDRDFAVGKHLLAAPGAQATLYRTPAALRGIYGDTPTGVVMFIRFRLR